MHILVKDSITKGCTLLGEYIRQFNNIDFSSEVSTVHKVAYTDEALLLVRQ